jgi:hypothetical protein
VATSTEEDKEKYLKAKREKELTEDKENEVYQKKKGKRFIDLDFDLNFLG